MVTLTSEIVLYLRRFRKEYVCYFGLFEDLKLENLGSLRRILRRKDREGVLLSDMDLCDYCDKFHLMYKYNSTSKYTVTQLEDMIYEHMVDTSHPHLKYVSKGKGGTGEQTGFGMYLGKVLDVLLELDILDL